MFAKLWLVSPWRLSTAQRTRLPFNGAAVTHPDAQDPRFAGFNDAYEQARAAEGWRYSDDEVRGLPRPPANGRHGQIWRVRKHSAERLCAYLQGRDGQRLMELGCGNGWLARCIRDKTGLEVLGVDVATDELAQAERLFGGDRLKFRRADVLSEDFEPFDFIVIAGAVQYFADPPALWRRLDTLLNPGGEVHVIDSPVYADAAEAQAAAARGLAHYRAIGVEQMAERFHRHTWSAFPGFQRHGSSWRRRVLLRLKRPVSPFPWLIRRRAT